MDYFTVQQCDSKDNVIVNFPIVFDNYSNAEHYMNELHEKTPIYQVVKNHSDVVFNTHSKSSSNVSEDYSDDENLDGFTLSKYGRGYLMKIDSLNEMYGEPYFYGKDFDSGWWDASRKGWFFKETYLDMLLERGAQFSKSSNKSDSNVEKEFTGCKWKSYGKGWVLMPKKSHPKYGESYLGNYENGGWWNKHAGGWFFKECEYNRLNTSN